jgi:deoxyribodipyrimidine photolyase-like uncharacterized protein
MDHAGCESWSAGRESLRMECSYRHMRKKYFVLMAHLVGGPWRYRQRQQKTT